MKYIIAFLKFWYDFFIGDSWEIAAGVVILLVLVVILSGTALQGILWLLFPIGVIVTLSASVLWYARKQAMSKR